MTLPYKVAYDAYDAYGSLFVFMAHTMERASLDECNQKRRKVGLGVNNKNWTKVFQTCKMINYK